MPLKNKSWIAIGFLMVCALSVARDDARSQGNVKQIIVMIADGWGFNHVAATDYYDRGSTGTQVYESFPIQYAMSTYPIGGGYDTNRAWSDWDYVNHGWTDSAAAVTALASGRKTYNGSINLIGIGADDATTATTALEYAERSGMSTGVVSTVPFSHATPAGFVAHNASRDNDEQIAREMLSESTVDVIMGCGHPFYTNDGIGTPPQANSYDYIGKATWNAIRSGALTVADADGDTVPDPWTYIETKAQFDALASMSDPPSRVFGVPQVHRTLQAKRTGVGLAPYVAPLNTNTPTLATMAGGALNVLGRNPNGFFLMVEGGAVDWASHDGSVARMIEEMRDFNAAVQMVSDWIDIHDEWGETLLVVTGDHETGYLLGPESETGWTPIVNNGVGNVPGAKFYSGSHTNSLIPLYAKGPPEIMKRFAEAADRIDLRRGPYLDNVELGRILLDLVGRRTAVRSSAAYD